MRKLQTNSFLNCQDMISRLKAI